VERRRRSPQKEPRNEDAEDEMVALWRRGGELPPGVQRLALRGGGDSR